MNPVIQRWFDYFIASGVPERCAEQGATMRKPEEGDLFLACCDALIAAQTAVIAAESFGVGSCYIGDIMEQDGAVNLGQYLYQRKFSADFSVEMSRSVRAILRAWKEA